MYVGNMWIWWNSSSLWGNVWQACHDNNSKPVVKMITVCVTDACNEAYKRHKRVILKMRQNIWENDLRVSTVKYIIVYILLCLHEDHFLVCFVSSSKYTLWFIWLYNGKHTYDSTRSTSGASDTFYESLSLPMSPTRKSACDLLNLLSPKRSCSGIWGSSATSSILSSDPDEDHTRALNAGINDPPKEWRRPRGRPRQTWLRTIENDLKHQNLGLWSARHRA